MLKFLRINPFLRLGRVCLWFAVGWALAGPFDALEGDGALLALSGAAVGAVGSPACGIGVTAAFLLRGAELHLLLWWLVPLVVVYGIVQLWLHTVVSDQRMDVVIFAASGWVLSGRRGSGRIARVAEYAGYAVLAVPIVLLWVHGAPAASWTGLALAVLLHRWFFQVTRNLSRYRRTEVRVSSISWIVFLALLALSPVGSGFVLLWTERIPGTEAGVVAYLVPAAALTIVLQAYLRLSERAYRSLDAPPQFRHRMGFAVAYGFSFFPVWFCLLSAVVHAPTSALPTTFCLAAGAQALLSRRFLTGPAVGLHRLDASLFMRYVDGGHRDVARQAWREEVPRGRGGRPNFTLVQMLSESAIRICMNVFIPPPPEQWDDFENGLARRVELAVHWIDEAMALLNMVEVPRDDTTGLRAEYYAHRVRCLLALSFAYTFHGYPEDARRAQLEAAEMCRRADMPNVRALFTRDAWAAGLDIDASGDPAEVKDALGDPRIDPAVRARVMIDVAAILCARGQRERAVSFLESVGDIPYQPDGTGNDRIVRSGGLKRSGPVSVVMASLHVPLPSSPADLRIFELGIDALEESLVPLGRRELLAAVLAGRLKVPGSRLVKLGMALLDGGAVELGAEFLRQAGRRLLHDDIDVVAVEVLEVCGAAFKTFDTRRALACLEVAGVIRDRRRDDLLEREHRLAYAATLEPLHEDVVRLLVTSADQGALVKAFDLVERARSRDLVDLLGQTVPRPADHWIPDIAARLLHEERTAERAAESRVRLSDAYWEAVTQGGRRMPADEGPEGTVGWSWAKAHDAAVGARVRTRQALVRLHDSGAKAADLYLAWLFGQEAAAEQRLRSEARRMRIARDKAGPLRGRRQARDRQEHIWRLLTEQGGRAAEYVALRSGTPITYDEIRALLTESARDL
ncbi:hypothetical protein AB0C27_54745 [Nonomuraea sp. NPDC048882]|uniref:hypothetical protein n=1 Tax=Nonomuraea sp. NPDC048882 TaxID=3154347 RepID=UPI0034043D16